MTGQKGRGVLDTRLRGYDKLQHRTNEPYFSVVVSAAENASSVRSSRSGVTET